jgi:N-acetyl-alpha-D-glucosaminyl L-malate synthase BshA
MPKYNDYGFAGGSGVNKIAILDPNRAVEARYLNYTALTKSGLTLTGVLATALGEDLAARGHDVHFISYERPFRLPADAPRLHFHPVAINEYELFRFPDYTLPLSVRMAEVSRDHHLDVLHVHYAVPHATAAILARAMLPPGQQPRVVTTLHGTDTTLLGRDAGYAPAILHALRESDAVTVVSESLERETRGVLGFDGPIEVIYNFFAPRPPRRPARGPLLRRH